MNKELEEAIAILRRAERWKDNNDTYSISELEAITTVLNYIENSIPKEIIEEKYKQADAEVIKIKEENRTKNNATKYDYLTVGKRDAYRELLEGK